MSPFRRTRRRPRHVYAFPDNKRAEMGALAALALFSPLPRTLPNLPPSAQETIREPDRAPADGEEVRRGRSKGKGIKGKEQKVFKLHK